MKEFWDIHFRPFSAEESQLALGIRSSGHYSVREGWHDVERQKDFVELFWCMRGSGEMLVDNRFYVLKENMAFFYFSGEKHIIRAREDWEYCWIAFDGDLADALVRGLGFASRLIPAGPCPMELFDELRRQVTAITLCGQKQALATGMNILCCIGAGLRVSGSGKAGCLVENAIEQMEVHYRDCNFDINGLAEILGVHRATLFRAFDQTLKISPIKYLKELRIQKALPMLKNTHLTIAQIAADCGFASADYFSRCICLETGVNPSTLRRR